MNSWVQLRGNPRLRLGDKLEMVRIQHGSQINSRNVDPGRSYARSRDINLLAAAGVPAEEIDLLRRADTTSRTPNGSVEVSELVRMESPRYLETLFPEERALQPSLWTRMEWSQVPAAGPEVTKVLPLSKLVKDVTLEPESIDFGIQLRIAELPEALQRVARRVQLVLNDDANPTTISLEDLKLAERRPVRFSTGDLSAFREIRDVIGAAARAEGHSTEMEARVQVPRVGVETIALPHAGRVNLALESVTTLNEERVEGQDPAIQLDRKWSIVSEVPPGHKAVLVNVRNGSGLAFDEGTQRTPVTGFGALYRVELWHGGDRVESSEIKIPAVADESRRLPNFTGYTFETPDGSPLARNVVEARRRPDGHYVARFSYGPVALPPEGVTSAQALIKVESPPITLPTGRYEVKLRYNERLSPAILDVFQAQRALRVKLGNGESYQLGARDQEGKKWFEAQSQGGIHLSFDPETNMLAVGARSNTVEVTPEQRIA
ncbi:MAG: hypothetical protein IPK13_01150 [Deltaproteobacteria bacterium]|nr:hypothetical protein [Deltaproteobacteria bacterium]